VALSFGDLSENSEYDEAKNEQAMVEARVNELETILKNVEVVNEDDITTDTVSVGSTVNVEKPQEWPGGYLIKSSARTEAAYR